MVGNREVMPVLFAVCLNTKSRRRMRCYKKLMAAGHERNRGADAGAVVDAFGRY
jgi:hypothetical protein